MTRLKSLVLMVCILLLAAFLRWSDSGIESLDGDHAFISIRAMRLAHYHEAPWVGPPMAIGMWHSPISIYLYASPTFFSTDARIIRMFTGLLNVIAIGLLYIVGKRYFGYSAALLASLFYATNPLMVEAGRAINNAQLGAPFAVGFLLTGLLGFYENKRWARWLCFPLLSLAGQCHPHTFAMAPVAAVLVGYAWLYHPLQRRQIITDTLLGVLGALGLLIPWGIGLSQIVPTQDFSQVSANFFTDQGLTFTLKALYQQLGGPGELQFNFIIPTLMVLGVGWLIVRAIRGRAGLPGLVVLLAFFLMPVVVVALKIHLVIDYFWPTFPIAYLIPSAVLGAIVESNSPWRFAQLLPAGALILVAVVMSDDAVYYANHRWGGEAVSLEQQLLAYQLASKEAAETNRDLLIVPNGGYDDFMPWEMIREAALIQTGIDTRVVLPARGLPLPTNGAVLLGPANYSGGLPFLNQNEIIEHELRLAELPPASSFQLTASPLLPIHMSNGFTILGLWSPNPPNLPKANQNWTAYVIWQVDRATSQEYTLFAHLVNQAGDRFGQADVFTLPAGQQRVGEQVINQINLQLGDGLSVDGPLFLRVGLYNSAGQAQVVDEAHQTVGDFGLIQIRGHQRSLQTWPVGIVLDDLVATTPLSQGPPLEVTLTWQASKTPNALGPVRWRLLSSQAQIVFETQTPLSANVDPRLWPTGAFVVEHYLLRIPTDIQPGHYYLELQLLDQNQQPLEPPFKTEIEITARPRVFEAPTVTQKGGAIFGETLKLFGYDQVLNGKMLDLTLFWQALGQVTTDYKYFVHVWQDGKVVAQVDSVPGDYSYFTSWWAPNEFYAQNVHLDLNGFAAGRYTVTTGFYNALSGERLPVRLADNSQPSDRWVTINAIELP